LEIPLRRILSGLSNPHVFLVNGFIQTERGPKWVVLQTNNRTMINWHELDIKKNGDRATKQNISGTFHCLLAKLGMAKEW
jgi:hypothetical protein